MGCQVLPLHFAPLMEMDICLNELHSERNFTLLDFNAEDIILFIKAYFYLKFFLLNYHAGFEQVISLVISLDNSQNNWVILTFMVQVSALWSSGPTSCLLRVLLPLDAGQMVLWMLWILTHHSLGSIATKSSQNRPILMLHGAATYNIVVLHHSSFKYNVLLAETVWLIMSSKFQEDPIIRSTVSNFTSQPIFKSSPII